MSRNAPTAQPPRDIQQAPSEYLPPAGCATVTTVTTTRQSPDPGDPGLSRDFTTNVSVTKSPHGESSVAIQGDSLGFKNSVFSDALGEGKPIEVSETCKFAPDEQQRLVILRRQLVSCAKELVALDKILSDDEGRASGLPHARESYRSRLQGGTYSVEDARRELCCDRLAAKMSGYINFIDSALADGLDPPPHFGCVQTTSPPVTMHGKAQGFTPVVRRLGAPADDCNKFTRQPSSGSSGSERPSPVMTFTAFPLPAVRPLGI